MIIMIIIIIITIIIIIVMIIIIYIFTRVTQSNSVFEFCCRPRSINIHSFITSCYILVYMFMLVNYVLQFRKREINYLYAYL